MADNLSTALARGARAAFWCSATLLAAGCASQGNVRDAINDINAAFRADYEETLATQGQRTYKAERDVVFDAMLRVMAQLGMHVSETSRALGYGTFSAPAPRPLSKEEWSRAASADLPKAREILRRHVGGLAEFFTFEPEGLDIVINATVVDAPGGAELSMTMRMRENAPPRSGLPRREYPPPSAVKVGLDKIWTAVEQELRSPPGRR